MNAEPQPEQEGFFTPETSAALDRATAAAREGAQRLEHLASESVDRAVTAARDSKTRNLLASSDALLRAVGTELSVLAIIALALAILCAPIALGLAAVWFAGLWAAKLTGLRAIGWLAGAIVFLFLCRYVWGAKLQRACRRAALALIAGMGS